MCQYPQVLKGDKLSSLSNGHVRRRALAQYAGPRAALALRQRQLHSVGGALSCPQLTHHRKELNPSVMGGGGGGFGYMKTLLLHKILANEKRGGGYVRPPPLV